MRLENFLIWEVCGGSVILWFCGFVILWFYGSVNSEVTEDGGGGLRLRGLDTYLSEIFLTDTTSFVIVFHCHFEILPWGRDPDHKTTLNWLDAFRETGNVSKRNGRFTRTIIKPENVERIRQFWRRATKYFFPKYEGVVCQGYLRLILYEWHITQQHTCVLWRCIFSP